MALVKTTAETFIEQEVSKDCKKIDANGDCEACQQNTIPLMSVCYGKVANCKKQVGTYCLVCNNEFSLVNNACVNNCGLFM